jgi:hypothetical protein
MDWIRSFMVAIVEAERALLEDEQPAVAGATP